MTALSSLRGAMLTSDLCPPVAFLKYILKFSDISPIKRWALWALVLIWVGFPRTEYCKKEVASLLRLEHKRIPLGSLRMLTLRTCPLGTKLSWCKKSHREATFWLTDLVELHLWVISVQTPDLQMEESVWGQVVPTVPHLSFWVMEYWDHHKTVPTTVIVCLLPPEEPYYHQNWHSPMGIHREEKAGSNWGCSGPPREIDVSWGSARVLCLRTNACQSSYPEAHRHKQVICSHEVVI